MRDIASVRTPQSVPWDRNTFLALSSLFCIWGALFAVTWAHWGDLTVDCGREMYASAELAQGRTLYSDVWYPYTPGGPYLNGLLFRLFGFQLGVLYWAGALAALGSAVFLFLTGLQLVSRAAAWTAGAVILLQSFVPGIFTFPLPYSFGAVYGCLSACVFLWLMVNACASPNAGWMLGAGLAASAALLMKQEIGAGCFAVLSLLVLVRGFQHRSLRRVAIDVVALMPSLLLSIAVILWMISLRGAEFLTQENLMSWPTSYFMKTYGALWLSVTGLAITWRVVLIRGIGALLIAAVVWFAFRWILARYGQRRWLFGAGLLALTALLILGFRWDLLARAVRWLFFPPAATFLVTVMMLVTAWQCWRNRFAPGFAQIFLLFSLAFCIAFRIMFKMEVSTYAIYYNGPVLLSFFVILRWLFDAKMQRLARRNRGAAILPYLATLVTVILAVLPLYEQGIGQSPFATARGIIYTVPEKARAYRSLFEFIQQHSGEKFLSIPEDMSLYFFAGVHSPTRVYQFAPGVLAPGSMTAEVIQQVDQARVRYLIWSNRTFKEYGAPTFGVDFDQALGEYLRTAYRPVRKFGDESSGGWKAVVWERIGPQSQTRPASAAQ